MHASSANMEIVWVSYIDQSLTFDTEGKAALRTRPAATFDVS